jgi:N-acetylglucosamine kinase
VILCFDIGGSTIKAALARTADDLTPLGRAPTPLTDFDAFVAAIAHFGDRRGRSRRWAGNLRQYSLH